MPRRRPVLLHGPYHPPAVRKGDRIFCQIRGSAVVTVKFPADAPTGSSERRKQHTGHTGQ